MATKKNVSTDAITYGFAGADFPDLKTAVDMAKLQYDRALAKYNNKILERFDQALVTGDCTVHLKLTYVGN